MKLSLVRCMTLAVIAFWVNSAAANPIDVDSNLELGPNELPGLSSTFNDNDPGDTGAPPDRVRFSFTSGAGNPSSVFEVQNFGGEEFFSSVNSLVQSTGVGFAMSGGGNNSSQPGGNAYGFHARNTADRLDHPGQYLGILSRLFPGITLDDLRERQKRGNPFNVGDDHDQEVLPGAPVPEPTSLLLFGIGAAGLAGLKRKRRNAN